VQGSGFDPQHCKKDKRIIHIGYRKKEEFQRMPRIPPWKAQTIMEPGMVE
jgi:DNA uptake protein ComE-like DNA-binding protein